MLRLFITAAIVAVVAGIGPAPGPSPVPMPYCSPGCNSTLVGDGMCNPECLSTDCQIDGGDCLMDPILSNLDMYFMEFDVDHDMRLNFSEYQSLLVNGTNITDYLPMWQMPDEFNMYVSVHEYGITPIQLGLIVINSMQMMGSEEWTETHAALALVWLADKDYDGRVSQAEAQDAYDVSPELYMKMWGEWTAYDIAHDLMDWFQIFEGGLDGDDFDYETAVEGTFVLDFNGDDKIDMHEAALIGMGPLFKWVDLDGDGRLSEEEVKTVIMEMKDDACDGFELLAGREGEIESKVPLTRNETVTCAWLIQPAFFYAPEEEEQPTESLQRRSGKRPAAAQSKAAQRLRARVSKQSGEVVVARAQKGKEQQRLRAKEVEMRAREQAQTRSFGGDAPQMGAFPFVASVVGAGSAHLCAGALVEASAVLTTAHCVETVMEFQAANPGAALDVYIGGPDATSGDKFGVASMAMHPSYMVDGGFDAGVIFLTGMAAAAPAVMYDGGDIGINDCTRMTMSYLGFDGSGVLARANMTLFNFEECREQYHWATGMEVVGGEELCAKTKMHDGNVDCKSVAPGSPLVVRVPTKPDEVTLVGLSVGSEDCAGRGFPAVFTRTAAVLQWVRSLDAMGQHPAVKVELTIEELGLPPHATLEVYKGAAALPWNHLETLDSKCQVPKTMNDEGEGSMLLVLAVQPLHGEDDCDGECFEALGIKGEYGLLSCEDNFEKNGEMTRESCEEPGALMEMGGGIRGCMLEEAPEGMMMCSSPPANMSVPWSRLGPMEDMGKVFSGGLGKRAEKTHSHEYGVWTCIRDWDAAEQLACGARRGELCCYWFEEMSRQWHFRGLNGETKLVRESEVEAAMEAERHLLKGRTLPTSPDQMY